MISELNIIEEEKGYNYISNQGRFLGIIEEENRADTESMHSDRSHASKEKLKRALDKTTATFENCNM